jgi:hypothetical protein
MGVICFSGWKGSGKDECAKYLIENHNASRVALADPLKDSVAFEFSIARTSLDDPKLKESPILHLPVDPKDAYSKMIAEFLFREFRNKDGKQPTDFGYWNRAFQGTFSADEPGQLYWTPRALAILKGSTNRSVTSSYWTEQAFGDMEAKLKENPNSLITVTDVRYRSELAQFKERFGDKVVFARVNRFNESPSQDPSERDLDGAKFDFYVDNTGSLSYLHGQLVAILPQLK